MTAPDSERRVCEQCGAPLAQHPGEGLCSRCIARFSLGETGEGELNAEGNWAESGGAGLAGVTASPGAVTDLSPAPCGRRFGDYELPEEIARGGMGVVYRARQVSLKRIVALKMVLFGQYAGKTAFDRFHAEAETVARLQHPNIVAIHTIGEIEGQPYFSMDYVAGRNLADVVRDRPLPVRKAADYVRKIARAVQYAHSQGVLHRDLKPANILIDEADEPRMTDFGLARRLTGDSGLTLTGQVLGSPNFMPPEQGAGRKIGVGPASDVYGLGALLYYLVTARPPFVAESLEATLVQVLNTDPVAPRQLNPGLPLDLETICLKCLEKDPARRYVSAGDVAEELDRFLKGEPIHARAIGVVGRGWRWCRRKPVLAAMTAAVLALLVTVTVVSVTAARRTEQNARDLRLNLYVADMNVAYQAVLDNRFGLCRALLMNYRPVPQGVQEGAAKQPVNGRQEDLHGWEWRYLWRLAQGDSSLATFRGHSNSILCAMFCPNGRTLVTASSDRTVRIWDAAAGTNLRVLTGFSGGLEKGSVVLSPDGTTLVVADGTDIHVFETTNWNKVQTLPNRTSQGYIFSLPMAFSPDGKTLSCGAETEIRHWDTTSWERRASQPADWWGAWCRLLTYSPDGRHLATSRNDGILIRDISTNRPAQHFFLPLRQPTSVVFSPDGTWVAAAGLDTQAIVWDMKDGKEMVRLPLGETHALAEAVACSPDGKRLATAGDDMLIRLWEMPQGKLITALKAADGPILALGFSPDGRMLLSGGGGGKARLWSALPETTPGKVLTAGTPLCFSADGGTVAVLGTNSSVEYWDVHSRNLVNQFKLPFSVSKRDRVAASPNGELLAHVCAGEIARIWDCGTGQQIAELSHEPPPILPSAVFSRDSHWLAISCDTRARSGGGWTMVWDVRRKERHVLPGTDIYRPSFSLDSKMLATGSGNDVQLWSIPDFKPLGTPLKGHKWVISGLAFSPDGALLASLGKDGEMRIWEVATGRLKLHNPRLNGHVTYAGFSADGRTLASGSNLSPNLVNVATGRVVLSTKGTHRYLVGPMFSPDGNTLLLAGSMGGEPIEILNAPSMEEIEAVEKAERQLQ